MKALSLLLTAMAVTRRGVMTGGGDVVTDASMNLATRARFDWRDVKKN
jgi:hypothetical protein